MRGMLGFLIPFLLRYLLSLKQFTYMPTFQFISNYPL
jgi:hypothetical protein